MFFLIVIRECVDLARLLEKLDRPFLGTIYLLLYDESNMKYFKRWHHVTIASGEVNKDEVISVAQAVCQMGLLTAGTQTTLGCIFYLSGPLTQSVRPSLSSNTDNIWVCILFLRASGGASIRSNTDNSWTQLFLLGAFSVGSSLNKNTKKFWLYIFLLRALDTVC